jgi:hypothetical protein
MLFFALIVWDRVLNSWSSCLSPHSLVITSVPPYPAAWFHFFVVVVQY